jgi:NAD(P)-dependent dehydrogenase (short-subunit alcohol dehydrogenase family)
MAQMDGKVALVTGAGSGIGRASALAFAAEGCAVVVADVDSAGGAETVQMIAGAGGAASFVRADVARAADVEALVAQTVETYGRLDCAFNNAGVPGPRAPALAWTEDDWEQTVSVNLKGVWLCMKQEIARMVEQGGGAVVNISSIGGLNGLPNASVYAACSHGVIGLTKSAALEYAQAGIRINAICPGVIRTPMIERLTGGNPEAEARMARMQPLGRMGQAEEIARTVVWLCSDAASFITGVALPADGGRAAG